MQTAALSSLATAYLKYLLGIFSLFQPFFRFFELLYFLPQILSSFISFNHSIPVNKRTDKHSVQ